MEANGAYRLEKWTATVGSYDLINGYMLPKTGEALWHLPDGDFSYFKGKIVEIEYNHPVTH